MRPHGLALLLALGTLGVCLAAVRERLEPPRPLAIDADEQRFSAARALDRLKILVGDDTPHPVGSPADTTVQRRLHAELTALGLETDIQSSFACSFRGASCGRVGNVVARLPGREHGPALLVSAHHDSVPAGPGAGDDGSGVSAVLEVARALSRGPQLKNPVFFLLVDGEEAGLLGAEAFVRDHPWAREVGAAVNLDAGGTRGVTSITRTSPGNAALVDAFAATVPTPYGASVTGAVYSLTPYDTDWSVYNRNGITALDLGFGEDKAHYHTPLDRLANLDPASVQHLGDTALAVVRRLADADLPTPPPHDFAEQHKSRPRPWLGERVFLDALGLALISWPAVATPILAILTILILSLATWRMRPVLQDSRRLPAILALPLLLAVPAALAGGLGFLLAKLTGAEFPGHVDPLLPRVAIWTTTLAVSGLLATRLIARLGPARLALAIWWGLALLTLVLAFVVPSASVGFLPPVLLAAVCLAICPRNLPLALLLALPLPGLLWLQAAVRLEAMFGLGIAGAGVLALVSALVAPLWPARPRLPLTLVPVALVAAALTLTRPAYSDERPRRLSLVLHHDADTNTTRWLVDADLPLPHELAERFDPEPSPAFPWTPDDEPSWTAPADPISEPPPILSREPDSPSHHGLWGRYLKLRLRSPRGARTAALIIPDSADVRSLTIAGTTLPLYPEHRRERYRDVRHHPIVDIPREGLVVELIVRSHDPISLTVIDAVDGLPANPLTQARPTWAIPSHGGDRSIISASYTF